MMLVIIFLIIKKNKKILELKHNIIFKFFVTSLSMVANIVNLRWNNWLKKGNGDKVKLYFATIFLSLKVIFHDPLIKCSEYFSSTDLMWPTCDHNVLVANYFLWWIWYFLQQIYLSQMTIILVVFYLTPPILQISMLFAPTSPFVGANHHDHFILFGWEFTWLFWR